jgi:hypothetical protein
MTVQGMSERLAGGYSPILSSRPVRPQYPRLPPRHPDLSLRRWLHGLLRSSHHSLHVCPPLVHSHNGYSGQPVGLRSCGHATFPWRGTQVSQRLPPQRLGRFQSSRKRKRGGRRAVDARRDARFRFVRRGSGWAEGMAVEENDSADPGFGRPADFGMTDGKMMDVWTGSGFERTFGVPRNDGRMRGDTNRSLGMRMEEGERLAKESAGRRAARGRLSGRRGWRSSRSSQHGEDRFGRGRISRMFGKRCERRERSMLAETI